MTTLILVALAQEWTPLFTEEGVPKGWLVRNGFDVAKPGREGAAWKVEGGILRGAPGSTWLVSEKEYGDFMLEFEWKVGEAGNGGCGLRFPLKGDPAFEGMELQMADPGYYNHAKVRDMELTGSIYSALAAAKQVYKTGEWNKYEITCKGAQVTVVLNGEKVIDANLDDHPNPTVWKNGKPGPALKDRPRRGRIGIQDISKTGKVEVKNARLKVLDESAK